MLKLFKLLKPVFIPVIIAIIGLLVFQVWCDTNMPEYLGNITGYIFNNVQNGTKDYSKIVHDGLIMLGLSAGSVISTIVVSYLSSLVGTSFSATLRDKVYNKVDSFSKNEINSFQTASLITRSTSDIAQIQMGLIFGIRLLVTSPLTIIIALLKMQAASAQLGLILALVTAISVLIVMIIVLFFLAYPKFKIIQEKIDKLNLYSRENLMGVRVIRAYNAEQYQDQKYEKANDDFYQVNLYANKAFSFFNPGMQVILNLLNLGLIIILAFLINNGNFGFDPKSIGLGVASQMEFQGLAMQIFFSFMMLTMLFFMLPRAQISAKRVNEVLNKKLTIIDKEVSAPIDYNSSEPIIEFKNVAFKYGDANEYVLHNINLACHKGEVVAFIGSTGSGKSTLINLVPRFFDPTEGQILYHGVDIKDIHGDILREKMGYVPQAGFLFNTTIRDNMRYADENVSDEQINEALRIACADDFVAKLEGGLDYKIAGNGKNVSGGQRQRLSIARALLKNPDIYIFDDSFSALDFKTDQMVRNNLKNKIQESLTLIVSQRIGTILNAQKIVVLDKGRIIGVGTHRELINTCQEYRELAYSQLSKEELGQ